MSLAEQLDQAKRRQEIADLDAGDGRVAAEFAKRISLPPMELSADIRTLLDPFNKWASERHARRCPAKSSTVALFALHLADMGVEIEQILAQLNAVEQMHARFGLSSPVRSPAVQYALETLIKTEPPRSWSKSEKAEWALLPLPIRNAIARRERDRDLALTRAQNEFAKLRKSAESESLRQNVNGADKTAHIQTEEDQPNEVQR
jgi:hypothetical protein